MLSPIQQKVELILAYTMNLWEHAVSKFIVLRSRPKAVGIPSRLRKRLNFVSGLRLNFGYAVSYPLRWCFKSNHWSTLGPTNWE